MAGDDAMSDLKRLKALLDSEVLLHPVSDELSIVDLANALHSIMGVPNVSLDAGATRIKRLIGEPEHLVLVMADGFGMSFVEELDGDSFVRAHLVAEMRTVFPSTTPIALTSLATGEWPGKHAVIGWFLRLREINAVSTIISYARTVDRKPLSELGVGVEEAYPVPSRLGRMGLDALHIMPDRIVGSVYSKYWTGGISQRGYEINSPQQAVDLAIEGVLSARKPTCVYLYLPQVDNAAHILGASHRDTLKAAQGVDLALSALRNALPSNSRVVMTADHGHLDAPEHKRFPLDLSDEIIGLSRSMPTGDLRAVYVDVPGENMDAFREYVHSRFGDEFLVVTAEEIESTGLLGLGELSDETRNRMGNALVLSTGDALLDYRAALGEKEVHPMMSAHGGLTPAEIRIPLVIA